VVAFASAMCLELRQTQSPDPHPLVITESRDTSTYTQLLPEECLPTGFGCKASHNIVVIKFMAPKIELIPDKCKLKIARSTAPPEWLPMLDSGG